MASGRRIASILFTCYTSIAFLNQPCVLRLEVRMVLWPLISLGRLHVKRKRYMYSRDSQAPTLFAMQSCTLLPLTEVINDVLPRPPGPCYRYWQPDLPDRTGRQDRSCDSAPVQHSFLVDHPFERLEVPPHARSERTLPARFSQSWRPSAGCFRG